MASLISTAEKNTLNGILRDVHDTFSRDIAIIKEAQKTVSTPSSASTLFTEPLEPQLA